MKQKYTFLLMILFVRILSVAASHSIRLQFQPDLPLDSIRIENLDNLTTKTFIGGSDLHFFFGVPTSLEYSIAENDKISIFSSHDMKDVKVCFFQTIPGLTSCEVYNLNGELVGKFSGFLENSYHSFSFYPDSRGVFLVRVISPSSTRTAKFVSFGASPSAMLKYEGFTQSKEFNYELPLMKMPLNQKTKLIVRQNDLLRIKCFSGKKIQTFYDYASGDKNYTFCFNDRYHQFQLFNIVASKPSFIDVMYAITDHANKGVDDLNNLDFMLKEDGLNILVSESFQHLQRLNVVPFETKTILLIDNGNSIINDLSTVKAAALTFVKKVRPNQAIAVYVFSDIPILLQDFTNDTLKLEQAINSIGLGDASSNLYGSIITALSRWNDQFNTKQFSQGSLIVFTDCNDTKGVSTLDAVISARGSKKIYMIGLGNEITPEVLNQISYPSSYISINKANELEGTFNQIQADIVRYSNSFYWLNYMSPKRDGMHTLTVSSSGNTNLTSTGTASGSFSATGFQSVNSGVYVNMSDTNLYGIDSVFCFYNGDSHNFTSSRFGLVISKDSLMLKPQSYLAINQPEYNWSIGNTTFFKIEDANYNMMLLKGVGGDTINTTLNIFDQANSYSKQVNVQMHPENPLFKIDYPINISEHSVTIQGAVLNEGRLPLLSKGFVWDTSPKPTVSLPTKTYAGNGKGKLSSSISDLKTGTKYYLRIYSTNSAGSHYSNEMNFTTNLGLPELTTYSTSITTTTASLGGNITHDGGAAVTARGICWSTSHAPSLTDNITSIGLGTGSFVSSISNLKTGTTYFVRAYATNSKGTAYGNELIFTTLKEGELSSSQTGRVWMDRNLGASRAAISNIDELAYGDLYQWGRSTDGHEKRTSWTTTVLSSSDTPGHNKFILIHSLTDDWRSPQNDNLWQGVNGINNPCPSGFRIPTKAEWQAEADGLSNINSADTNDNLKLTKAGHRYYSNGDFYNVGSVGIYWSATVNGMEVHQMHYYGNRADTYSVEPRAYGSSVRCIKDAVNININPPTLLTSTISSITNTSARSGGVLICDGGAAITSCGVVWSTSKNPTDIMSTKTNEGSVFGTFTSFMSGLNPNTTYYMRAYATNSAGTAYGNMITFKTTSAFLFSTVKSITGRLWMDRNLGADRVAISSDDSLAYGDLYQFGRFSDGHEKRYSKTTSELSSSDTPGHRNFIMTNSGNYDWRSTQNDNLWQGVNGTNNPCPSGFRIPTGAEWNAERESWISNDSTGAFASPLKLPMAGGRGMMEGDFFGVGFVGGYWSSTVRGIYIEGLGVHSGDANVNLGYRVLGYSVRCIKD